MATSGAFNGTDVYVRVNDGSQWIALGGQTAHSETLNNNVIDISNKIGTPKYRELLADQGTQSVDYSVDMVFTSQAGYNFVRALAENRGQALFQTIRGDVATGVATVEALFQVQSFIDTSADGEALTGTISLLSSDAFEFGVDLSFDALITSDGENFITSDGHTFYVIRNTLPAFLTSAGEFFITSDGYNFNLEEL
jgi:predicted secreted protein